MGDALPNPNATLPTRTTPERGLPGTTTAPSTRTTWPTMTDTAKHQAAKRRSGFMLALDAIPSPVDALRCLDDCRTIKTNGIDSRSEQPMSANRDERARVNGGFPSKVWAMNKHRFNEDFIAQSFYGMP